MDKFQGAMLETNAHLQSEFLKDPGSMAMNDDRVKMDYILGKQKKWKLDRADKHIRASIHQFNRGMRTEVAGLKLPAQMNMASSDEELMIKSPPPVVQSKVMTLECNVEPAVKC